MWNFLDFLAEDPWVTTFKLGILVESLNRLRPRPKRETSKRKVNDMLLCVTLQTFTSINVIRRRFNVYKTSIRRRRLHLFFKFSKFLGFFTNYYILIHISYFILIHISNLFDMGWWCKIPPFTCCITGSFIQSRELAKPLDPFLLVWQIKTFNSILLLRISKIYFRK